MNDEAKILDRIESVKKYIFGEAYRGPKRNTPIPVEACGFLDEIITYAAYNLPEVNTAPLRSYRRTVAWKDGGQHQSFSGYMSSGEKHTENGTALCANDCLDDIKQRISVKRGHDIPYDTTIIEGTIPCRLLKSMWGRSSVSINELAQAVWGKDGPQVSESAVSNAIGKANNFLCQQKHGQVLSRAGWIVKWT